MEKDFRNNQTATPQPQLIVLSCGQVISELLVLITVHYRSAPLSLLQGGSWDTLDYYNVGLISQDGIEKSAQTHTKNK